jgi:hypothetical protein
VTEAELAAALREFVERIGALDPASPAGPPAGQVEVRVGGAAVTLGPAVARALTDALRAYHDPRDRGRCGHCGGRRLDGNFQCADCGHLGGVFGQLVRERAARYAGPPRQLG